MGDTLTVSLDTSKDEVQPTLEELSAKMDEANPPVEEDRPDWLPEKFKSVEDMAKAYSELEKKLGGKTQTVDEAPKAPEKAQDGDQQAKATETPPTEDAAREAVKQAGLDFNKLSEKYWEAGTIDESDYQALEAKGIPKTMVDQFIAGQEAILNATRSEVFNTVGGEARYDAMREWAANTFDGAEIDAFNRAVNSGQKDLAMFAVKGLKARYDAEQGFEPRTVVTGSSTSSTGEVYESIAQMQTDMSNPKYKTDPAFRKMVERKLSRSDIM